MLIEIHTTCGSEDEARRIARLAVEQRLCACTHITPTESCYRWQNAIQHETEYALTFKTTGALQQALMDMIGREHSYELPAIYITPVLDSTAAYSEWIHLNTRRP